MSVVNSRERPQAALDGRGKEAPISEFLLSLELAQMFLGHTEIDSFPKPRPPAMVLGLLTKSTDAIDSNGVQDGGGAGGAIGRGLPGLAVRRGPLVGPVWVPADAVEVGNDSANRSVD